MAVPYTFSSATSAIPLSQLDSNFATTITLGNTAIQLGNTVTTLNNMTLANVTVTTVSGASANAVVYTNSSGQVTANSSVIALDTSGNLGLGVTPSTYSLGRAVEVGAAGNAFWALSNDVYITANTYYQSSYKYAASGISASAYEQTSGSHRWLTAASGTAGNAISFTQAMTLDASGRLLLGTTSALGNLTIGDGSSSTSTASYLNAGTGGNALIGRISGSNTWFVGDTVAAIGSGTGMINYVYGANPWIVYTNATERARIDSSGNLLVGTTSFALSNSNNLMLQASAGTIYAQHANGTSSGTAYAGFSYNGSNIGSITQNGTTGVLYNLTSDYRLKNNPTPVTGAKEFVMALQPKTWDWWDGSGKGVGFIAHEFMEVAHYSGHGEKDAVDENGNPVYQSIQPSSSEVMANLVALLQEQQAIITQLQADVQALKGAK